MRFEWKGIKSLADKLEDMKNLTAAKAIVKKNGAQLDRKMVTNAQFKGHYEGKTFVKPTGQTRRSINLKMEDDDMTAVVQPSTEYSPYLEYGTRFMEKQEFVGPAYREQKEIFKNDLDKLVE